MIRFWLALLLLAIALAALSRWLLQDTPLSMRATLPLADLIDCSDPGFARVESDRRLAFPDDHGAHPAVCAEYWSFAGILNSSAGRAFGFQLTFARLALAPRPPPSNSAWATHQIYRAHLAVTDAEQGRLYAFERFSRAALGLAGAQRSPLRVWTEGWEFVLSNVEKPVFRLHAAEDEVNLELRLESLKPVLAGTENNPDSGAAQMNLQRYIVPRLSVSGALTIGANKLAVSGQAWLEHAWGAVPLGQRGQLTVNRFTLQLDDSREFLLVQLRRRDGSGTPIVNGLQVMADGTSQRLRRRDIVLEALEDWQSPLDETRYPIRWRLRLPDKDLSVDLVPLLSDQELRLSLRYWAGAVRASGQSRGQAVTGAGYVELTGYAPDVP